MSVKGGMRSGPTPGYPKSGLIVGVEFERYRYHKADGDMWPITWAGDGNLYGGAGDNMGSPMNFYRIEGNGPTHAVWLANHRPVPPELYVGTPGTCPKGNGIKPAGLLGMDGMLYFAVECMNYGDNPAFNRQRNLNGWIITSRDWGATWDVGATPTDFFTGRLASCHFLQFGRDYAGARDNDVYAYFPGIGEDGRSYWENGDYILLGRAPRDRILERSAWEFCAGVNESNEPGWSSDEAEATPVFRYPRMCGEDHVSYNAGIGRYILGNYGFLDFAGNPRPYHQRPFPGESVSRSQLTLLEAPEPWGPWSLFYRDDCWGTYGDYQPCFPTKLMSADGREMVMVSSGTWDDYNLTTQRLRLRLWRGRRSPARGAGGSAG